MTSSKLSTPESSAPATPSSAPGSFRDADVRIGQKVRVNNHFGSIRRIITQLQVPDAVHPAAPPREIPLRSPLYEVEVDRSKRVGWVAHARQVYLTPGKTLHRLFRDEFDVVS